MRTCCFWKPVGNATRRQKTEKGSCGVRATSAIVVTCCCRLANSSRSWLMSFSCFWASSDKTFARAPAFGCCAAMEAEVSWAQAVVWVTRTIFLHLMTCCIAATPIQMFLKPKRIIIENDEERWGKSSLLFFEEDQLINFVAALIFCAYCFIEGKNALVLGRCGGALHK